MLKGIRRIHLVGIGGAGMSGIAHVLLELGYSVSGSDMAESEITRRLAGSGARICMGHRRNNPVGAQLVIFSSAISLENPELRFAMKMSIPCFPRSWILAEMMKKRTGIAITGTHGKTTTASMVTLILIAAGLDPTALIGGNLSEIGGNACVGKGEYLVAEADESDGSFLTLSPRFAVVTNIDGDHLDYYGDTGCLMNAFESFSETVCSGGGKVFFSDHPNNLKLLRRLGRLCSNAVVYGLGGNCTLRGQDVREEFGKSSFSVMFRGKRLGEIELCLPGKYNVYNALAATAVAREVGVAFNVVREVLSCYRGADRRFQIRGEVNGVLVVEDYGHHPTEIRAALRAAKKSGRRIVAVFQPHRYSRTAKLAVSLGKAFGDADVLVVTDIYGAGESIIPNVSSEQIVESAEENGHSCACYVPDMWDVADRINKIVKSGDMLLILGAGNINELIEPILKSLKSDV